jgi:ATP-dependent Clp protease, protease subunit
MSAPRLKDVIAEKTRINPKMFLWAQVDDNSAKHVIERLMYLELKD